MNALVVANQFPPKGGNPNSFPRSKLKKTKKFTSPACRLFGPSVFEASKLKVMFIGVDDKEDHKKIPRTYTLTHSDITSELTLSISETINTSQLEGWYNKLQRDEVIREWKNVKGKMCLHVHCHISGGHFLLDIFADLRYYIFCKEIPLVLKAILHGDHDLFKNNPDLEEAMAWVHFHSNIPKFNRVECWGSLNEIAYSHVSIHRHPNPNFPITNF